MWKYFLLICAMANAVFLLAATSATKSDREKDAFIGPVQKVVEETGIKTKGTPILVQTTVYDQTGKKIESEISKYKVGKTTFIDKLRTVYERDSDGRITALKSFGSDGSSQSSVLYTYDKKSNPIEESHYDKIGHLLFKFVNGYDSEGNKIEVRTYLRDGSLKSKSQYTYDSAGHLTSASSFKDCTVDQTCKTLEYRTVNSHDGKGNMIESLIYKTDGTLDEKRTYSYDPNGNLTEKTILNADGSVREKENYTYKLDKVDNWIEMVTSKFTPSSRQKHVSTNRRKITYYEIKEKP